MKKIALFLAITSPVWILPFLFAATLFMVFGNAYEGILKAIK